MTAVREFTFPSVCGGRPLRGLEWRPGDGRPKAVVQLVHGIDEHVGRYGGFACFLAEQGFLVVGNDHLGHGRNVNPAAGERFGVFPEKDGWRQVVEDIHALRRQTEEAFPGLPHFLLGHSMGSFLVRTYLLRYSEGLAGAILSGTGWHNALVLELGLLAAKLEALRLKKYGLTAKSKLLTAISMGGYNKDFSPPRTVFDWLTRDEAIVDEHCKDPLCGHTPSVELFAEMFRALKEIESPAALKKMRKDLPVLLFSGAEDPVGARGKGVEKTYRAFLKAGCEDVTLKLYPEGRHEMLNELNRQEVYNDVLEWMARRH
ncbi:MAG: alpha/beta hydrolase [Bacillota bacterium]|nr:alpha/beta hydrolase [Bacillota bacterium]